MQQQAGCFISLEGIEGLGKSTVATAVAAYLRDHEKIFCLMTREPGGTGSAVAEKIREVLLEQYDETLMPETELLLLFAGRAQHIQHVIKPALARGTWVLCDRFTDASYAYQGYGRGIDITRIAWLEQWVQGELRPDVTLLLDAPVNVGVARMANRRARDRIESEKVDFFERARAGYLQQAQLHPERYRIINAAVTFDEVMAQVLPIIDEQIRKWSYAK